MKLFVRVVASLALVYMLGGCTGIPFTGSDQDSSVPRTPVGRTPDRTPPISTPFPTPSFVPSPITTPVPTITTTPTLVATPVPTILPTSTPMPAPTEQPAEKTPQPGLKTTTLSITAGQSKVISLTVEVASTAEELQTGLMNRRSLPEMQGMLFDFSSYGDSVSTPFYMKDTYISLSIAFISKDLVIVHIEDMEPLTVTLHLPDMAYRYALEVNKGWFERHGVKVGDKVKF